MDAKLLELYNNELLHLQGTAEEFAKAYPRIAQRLYLPSEGKGPSPDPYVERLLEGFAFLAARIQLKFSNEFARFAESLIETIYPQFLCPTPSMAIARFEPNHNEPALADGRLIPRETELESTTPNSVPDSLGKSLGLGSDTRCLFRTSHPVWLWPLRVVDAAYHTQDLPGLKLPLHADAAIRIRLEVTGGLTLAQLKLESLTFFIHGADALAALVYQTILTDGLGLVVRTVDVPLHSPPTLPPASIKPLGFEREEALLPVSTRVFEGYRLLREFFAFPQRFLSLQFGVPEAACGLGQTLTAMPGNAFDLIVPLAKREERLAGRVKSHWFKLFCTPVINLFRPNNFDPIPMEDHKVEFQAVPRKDRPLDFEVFDIQEVLGIRSGTEKSIRFAPFFRSNSRQTGSAYFTLRRTPRLVGEADGDSGADLGSEVYVSLVDCDGGPRSEGLRALSFNALCTNRHLPLQMVTGVGSSDFQMRGNAPISSISCLGRPTRPVPAPAQGEQAWKLIAHLAVDYTGLGNDPQAGATVLKETLRLYAAPKDEAMQRLIESIKSVRSRPIVRPINLETWRRHLGDSEDPSPEDAMPVPLAYARGLQITVQFDEPVFEQSEGFILGAVLDQFFAKFVSVNSFAQTIIVTTANREIIRWPLRLGTRRIG